jgi:hypothetical protein
MICSSLNLDRFIVRLPYLDGLYIKLEQFQGLRSIGIASEILALSLS